MGGSFQPIGYISLNECFKICLKKKALIKAKIDYFNYWGKKNLVITTVMMMLKKTIIHEL